MKGETSLPERALAFPESPIRKLNPLADRAKDAGTKVYHVNIGQPDIPTPDQFMGGMKESEVKVLSYSPSRGIKSTITDLVKYYGDHRIELGPDELMVTTGGSEAGLFAFFVTMEPGQEILIPEPFYTNYRGFAGMTGVNIVPIPTREAENFRLPEKEEIEALISNRTGAILLTNPSNPTGRVYGEAELETVRELVLDHDLFFISDEVYREFVYGKGEVISSFHLNGIEDRTVMIDSISKRLSVCGARIGVLASKNESLMASATKLGQARLSPPTMGQLGLSSFLNSPAYPEAIENMVERYKERRDVLTEELAKITGVSFGKPEGAFYLMASLPVENSEDFVRWALTDFRDEGETVMMAPGEGFYNTPGKGEDQVRLSYVLNKTDLRRVAELIQEALAEYRRSET